MSEILAMIDSSLYLKCDIGQCVSGSLLLCGVVQNVGQLITALLWELIVIPISFNLLAAFNTLKIADQHMTMKSWQKNAASGNAINNLQHFPDRHSIFQVAHFLLKS